MDELRDILSHCIAGMSYNELPLRLDFNLLLLADTITSATSTVPYNVTDLNEMLLLMNNLRSKSL